MPFRLGVFLLASLFATFIISLSSMGQVRVFFVCSNTKVFDEKITCLFHTCLISPFRKKLFFKHLTNPFWIFATFQ
jgi:hypothetical protein